MAAMAQINRPSCSSSTTSAEKVENVVRPPQKPVMMSSRHSGARPGAWESHPTAKPMM
jgi:hypothetical protein